MNYIKLIAMCGVLACLMACGANAEKRFTGQSMGEVVTNIVMSAQAGETIPFAPVFEPSGDLKITNLFGMIQKSGMLTNYSSRVQEESETGARLDYHDLNRGCHFQIDLEKNANTWRVSRIWFCR